MADQLEVTPLPLDGAEVPLGDLRAAVHRLVDSLVSALERRATDDRLALADQLAAQGAAAELARAAGVL